MSSGMCRVVSYKPTYVSEVLSASTIRTTMMKMKMAVRTFKMSVNLYKTTRRNTQEDSHLHTCRSENLKSHCVHILFEVTKYNYEL
jgi:hypothetical protein